ncbi:MAG: ABC transporter permease subunit [Saprospiraceae bacterium]
MKLLIFELYKIFSKPRTYISYGVILVIIFLIDFALLFSGQEYIDFLLNTFKDSFVIEGNILNGYMISYIILQTLIIHMPLLVALVSGDLISGEASSGTIKILLTRPNTRSQIYFTKWVTGELYTISVVILLGIVSLVFGIMLFGTGDLMVLKSDGVDLIQSDDLLWRFGLSMSLAVLGLSVVSTLSMMISAFVENSITPIILTMAIIILFTIIGTLDVPLFDLLRPYLFTTHMLVWKNLFDQDLNMNLIESSSVVLLVHILIFYSVGWYYFRNKDILN